MTCPRRTVWEHLLVDFAGWPILGWVNFHALFFFFFPSRMDRKEEGNQEHDKFRQQWSNLEYFDRTSRMMLLRWIIFPCESSFTLEKNTKIRMCGEKLEQHLESTALFRSRAPNGRLPSSLTVSLPPPFMPPWSIRNIDCVYSLYDTAGYSNGRNRFLRRVITCTVRFWTVELPVLNLKLRISSSA